MEERISLPESEMRYERPGVLGWVGQCPVPALPSQLGDLDYTLSVQVTIHFSSKSRKLVSKSFVRAFSALKITILRAVQYSFWCKEV